MNVIGKKLNPIQSSGGGNSTVGHNNDDGSGNNQSTQSITPDDVLSLSKIADEYMCSPGTYLPFYILHSTLHSRISIKTSTAPKWNTHIDGTYA